MPNAITNEWRRAAESLKVLDRQKQASKRQQQQSAAKLQIAQNFVNIFSQITILISFIHL
jgi:hypothetical protein